MHRRQNEDSREPAGNHDPRSEAPAYPAARGKPRRRNPARQLVPVLVLAGFGVLFARQEVPAFADWWERTFNPGDWQVRDTCRQAVLAELGSGRYARLREPGELHSTQDGPFVTAMRFRALDDEGRERSIEYNCYLDGQGRLARLNRVSE